MTTAARATFFASSASGSAEFGNWSTGGASSKQYAARDQAAHTKMKFRQTGQSSEKELSEKDLKEELEEKERKYLEEKEKERNKYGDGGEPGGGVRRLEGSKLLLKDKEEITQKTQKYDDRDDEADSDAGGGDDSDLESSDDDDDDDDDEELLRLELEKIKKEREEAKRKKEEEDKAEAQRKKEEEINQAALMGNPLLAPQSAQIKRRWNDDVVFKNQSRGEPEKKKRFINDTIRNEFHKSFLKRYMK